LRRLQIKGDNLAIIIRSGKENRILRGSQSVAVDKGDPSAGDDKLDPKPLDLTISLTKPAPATGAWILIEVATLQDLYLASTLPSTTLLLDRVNLPALRVMTQGQSTVLNDVNCGYLHLDMNGQGRYVASGQVQTLFVSAQQADSKFYLQDLHVVQQTHVRPKNLRQLYALKLSTGMTAFYDNPIQSNGAARDFPVEYVGIESRLKITRDGRANVTPLSAASRSAAASIRQEVMGRVYLG
jgi:hypothetical protein